MDFDTVRNDFIGLLAENENKIEDIHKKYNLSPALPSHLHHYTQKSGMEGILRKQEIWATNVRFLNDTTEVDHGVQAAMAVAQGIINDMPDGPEASILQDHLARVQYQANFDRANTDYYVTCFCEKADLLSQWRAYGGNTGYSLKFDADKLYDSVMASNITTGLGAANDRELRFEKVIYDPAIQSALLQDVLECTMGMFHTLVKKYRLNVDYHKRTYEMPDHDLLRGYPGMILFADNGLRPKPPSAHLDGRRETLER